MADNEGGRTGVLARLEREAKAREALAAFAPVEFRVNVFGNGRGTHLIEVLIFDVGDAPFVRNGWTLKDFLTTEGDAFTEAVRAAVVAVQRKSDVVKVSWCSNVLSPHMDRMRGAKDGV